MIDVIRRRWVMDRMPMDPDPCVYGLRTHGVDRIDHHHHQPLLFPESYLCSIVLDLPTHGSL